jgi:uncharacterized protein DUF6544
VKKLIISFVILATLGVVIRAGFQRVEPIAPPTAESSHFTRRTVLYIGLLPALQDYLTQTVGRTPSVTTSALAWGAGHITLEIMGIDFRLPIVWTEAIDIKRGYAWQANVMWWGINLATLVDRPGSREFPYHRYMHSRAKMAWMPSTLVTDVDWEPLGNHSAMMHFREKHTPRDTLLAVFNPRTRALTSLSGRIQKTDSSTWNHWRIQFNEWGNPGGLTIPVAGTATAAGRFLYSYRIDGIVYNMPLDEWFNDAIDRREAVQ